MTPFACHRPGTGWNGGRCNSCPGCKALKQFSRKRDWTERISWEILGYDAAYFVTYTFRFKPKSEDAYGDFQKYLKRVRKGAGEGCKIRFVCASEFGEKNGRYHLHAVVGIDGKGIVGRDLRGRWRNGITHCRKISAVDPVQVSRYVAKYVSKAGRIRASNGYGSRNNRVIENVCRTNETARAIFEAFPGAKIASIKAQNGVRIRPPYRLRGKRQRDPDVRPREWLGVRPASGSGMFSPPWHVYWGEFSVLPERTLPDELEGAEGG